MLMFTQKSFDVFEIEGLDERMTAIRSEIQPIFRELNDYFKEELEKELGVELFVHIAQHIRRTVYPPANTWSALSQKKRGYKMEAHFQLGIWQDYVYVWLSLIDNPKNEREIGQAFLDNSPLFEKMTKDYFVSLDHTQPKFDRLEEIDLEKSLIRFRDVKKGEFQIGRVIHKDDPLLKSPDKARNYMLETYQQLIPLYKLAIAQQQQ